MKQDKHPSCLFLSQCRHLLLLIHVLGCRDKSWSLNSEEATATALINYAIFSTSSILCKKTITVEQINKVLGNAPFSFTRLHVLTKNDFDALFSNLITTYQD